MADRDKRHGDGDPTAAARRLTVAAALSACLLPAWACGQERRFDAGIDLTGWTLTGSARTPEDAAAGLATRLELFKRQPGPRPAAGLTRMIDLSKTAEVRMKFRLGDPALTGVGLGLSRGKSGYRVATGKDRICLFASGPGLKHYYGGHLWRAGGTYEIRIALQPGEIEVEREGKKVTVKGLLLKSTVVPDDGLPRFQGGHTRLLPAEWLKGKVKLAAGCSFARDNVGTARIISVSIYKGGQEPPADVAHSRTVGESLAKYQALRDGKLTPVLAATLAELKADKTLTVPSPKRRFEVQMWDAGKIGYAGWSDATIAEMAKVYTLFQFRYVRPDDLRLIKKHGKGLGAAIYIVTRQAEYFAALKDSPDVVVEALYKGKPCRKTNFQSGDFLELSAKHSVLRLAPWMRTGIVRRVMLDSEYKVLIGDNPLARAAASADGVKAFKLYPDRRAGPYTAVLPDSDPVRRCVMWRYANMNKGVSSRTIAGMVRRLWPGVEVATDPILDYGGREQFRDLDVIQHWIRVHYAPRNPRSVAYYVERGQNHVRASGGEKIIAIGPQLGRGTRATPRHMLSEACWLALAFGAQGTTHWGFQAIRSKADGSWCPNGQAAWETLKRLRREVYDPHGELFLSWRPKPRRLAMLLSRADMAYQSGQRGYAGLESAENMYRALLSVGEPADVIYDADILNGSAKRYKAVVVPSLYVANQSLVDGLKKLTAAGVTVMAHKGSVLAGVEGVRVIGTNLAPVYSDYMIQKKTPGTLLPHQYAELLDSLAGTVGKLLPFGPGVVLDHRRIIPNLMTDGKADYLVLVNDNRRYGPEAEGLGAKLMLDEGVATDVGVKVPGVKAYVDVSSGKKLAAEDGAARISLEAGWGRILRLER